MKKYLLFLFFVSPLFSKAQIVQSAKAEDENIVFQKVEINGGFPGGQVKWVEFVKKYFNFSRIENALPDSVTQFFDTARLRFVVDKNGIISDVKAEGRAIPSFKQSCIEVIKRSPHWEPATQCGRAVNAYKTETFILQIDKATGKKIILVRS